MAGGELAQLLVGFPVGVLDRSPGITDAGKLVLDSDEPALAVEREGELGAALHQDGDPVHRAGRPGSAAQPSWSTG